MVVGLDIFKQYFEAYPDQYVIIGGTACDIIIEKEGFEPRATKDIDIILVVEALNDAFVKQFWQFIKDGNYERKERSDDQRQYYRFTKPGNKEFPHQVELFCRKPDVITLDADMHITPIPVDDDLSSLSAILLSDAYYNYMLEHSYLQDGVRLCHPNALICLKAKAFLEISERLAAGEKEDAKHIKKHKADVFRLTALLSADSVFDTPAEIKAHLQAFATATKNDMPDATIFKAMRMPGVKPEVVFTQFIQSFNLQA